ncbi:MAG: sugar ABC transporter permease [Clostridia bacterium]|nr:sugar ABC transporter permease [Clostridia bacterium]
MEKTLRKYWPLFVLPTMLAFVIGFLIPFFSGLYLSFCEFTTVADAQWVGLANYVKIFTDPTSNFAHSLWITSLFTVVNVILINVLGFVLALLLVRGFRGTNIFRTVFFMPNLIGGIVLGWIWNLLLTGVLAKFGKTLVSSEAYGFWGLSVLMLWQQAGYMMIIYISGLQSIPDDLIEAAAIDGATPLQTLFKIKIPMVMPSITICTFLTLTNSFKLFDQNYALINAESSNRLQLLAMDIYETFYGRPGWEGAGQAKAVVFTIIVAVLAMAQMRLTNRREVQQ